ncbi:hypothetical protein VaNZ11_015126 [Volvox africanus]|uniref:Uncharacterized protein n=1 Tax=Volvox africanus TaxID=51714 RepID=A0ABQ5SKH4_9CHLO|nr:hypothetical protein VaNZ11_015126 [Volvox africanus]
MADFYFAIENHCRLEMSGFCDSDFASTQGRRSTSGYIFLLGNGVISWSSKLQPTVATSTAKAEYMALAAAIKEALWLRHLLHDLGVGVRAVPLICDSSVCIAMLASPVSSARTKHIDICHHFAHERVERDEIRMIQCTTTEQVTDTFTKALPKEKLRFCISAWT